jgi:hypothetical protein
MQSSLTSALSVVHRTRLAAYGALCFGLLVAIPIGVSCSSGTESDTVLTASTATGTGSTSSSGNVQSFVMDGGATDVALPPAEPATDVDVVMTADNAYAFGWGNASGLIRLTGRPSTAVAGDIFNCPVNRTGSGAAGFGPEAYLVSASNAPTDGYLYIVTWDDQAVTQGVLGQFKRVGGSTLYSGDAGWEVCATGKFYDSRPGTATANGPPLEVVNQDLAVCNAGSGDRAKTSAGWVNAAGAVTPGAIGRLVVGQDNSKAGTFAVACQSDPGGPGIDALARWMWYSPDPATIDAFRSNQTRAYLIFRLPTKALPPGPR